MRFSQKKLQIATVLLLLLISNKVSAQWINFIGSINDAKSNEPIPYTNISLLNQSVGTCTNVYGDFVLSLPDSLSNSRLEISSIGYKSRSLPIDSLLRLDTIYISLNPVEYLLEDITVVPGQNDVQTIMKNVISKIDDNYSRKKYFLEAFLRHRVYNRMDNEKTTVRLTEADLSIHKNHYSKKENNRVQINEIRNSKNYAELNNSVGMKLFHEMMGGNQNPIYRILNTENYAQKEFLKNLMKNEHYSVELSGLSYFNNNLVYEVYFKQISGNFLFKTYYTTHTYNTFKYYINSKDFAILKAESTSINHNPSFKSIVINDSIAVHSFIQYRKFDDKYYPAYIYFYGGIPDMVSKLDDEHFYFHEAEMLINDLATRRKDYDRIKNKYRMNFKTTLWDMDYEYNEAFWKNYNLLLDHPLNTKYKKDLEFEEPLEEQFKKGSNDKVGN